MTQARGRFTRRGEAHAAVCANFIIGGLKGDQETCLVMPSSRVAECEKEQLAYLNIVNRLRTALHHMSAYSITSHEVAMINGLSQWHPHGRKRKAC